MSTSATPEATRPSFRTITAILIAVVSVLGAIAAWRASVVSIRASDLDEDGMLELVEKEQLRSQMESRVDEDLRLVALFQRHIRAWRLLMDDARRVRSSDPRLADALEVQAQGELAMARAFSPFFQASFPTVRVGRGVVEYDREVALSDQEAFNSSFQELRPDATFDQARAQHARTVNLVLVVALFIAALFFLTLAQFARPGTRPVFLGSGLTVAAAALALFIVVGA